MRKALSIMSVVSLGVCALAYGCSDDEKTNTLPRSDAGGGGDSAAVDSGGGGTDSGGNNDSGSTVLKAKATLAHTGLPNAGTPAGTVEFEDNGTSTTVKISVTGATAGDHGVHVHANGDCSTVDGGFGAGAGGHWSGPRLPDGCDAPRGRPRQRHRRRGRHRHRHGHHDHHQAQVGRHVEPDGQGRHLPPGFGRRRHAADRRRRHARGVRHHPGELALRAALRAALR
jgi:hypothetical protein